MAKIGRRIIIIVLLCISVVTLVSINLVENAVRDQLKDSSFKYLETAADNQAMRFENELSQVEQTTHEIKRLVESRFDLNAFNMQEDYMSKLLTNIEPSLKAITVERAINHSAYVFFLPEMTNKSYSIWFADLDLNGTVDLQEQFQSTYFDGDTKSKQWYYGPLLSQKGFWTEPYMGSIDADRNVVYFSYTEPVIVDGKVIAIVGNDYYFNQMQDEVSGFKLDGKGYAGLIDENGKVLIHPTLKAGVDLNTYQNGKYASIYHATQSDASGTFEYIWENDEQKLMVYNRLENGWTLIAAMSKAEINQDMYSYNKLKWVILLVGLLLTLLILQSVLKRIGEPIKQVKLFLDRLTEGNYTDLTPLKELNRNDEIGIIMRKLEYLRTELKRQSEHFLIDQEQLETLLKDKHEALIKTNEYLEVSLAQLRERNDELSLAEERFEGEQERSEKLANRLYASESLASLAYILSGLAHDLNSPLGNATTVISYTQNELDQLERSLKENSLKKQDFEEYIAVSKESLKLLERNINTINTQLLQFKRLTDGQKLHQSSRFNVKTELTKLFHQIADNWHTQQIRLNLNMQEINVIGDLGAFAQLFHNLLRYSLECSYAQTEKGMIHIRAQKIGPQTLQIVYEDFGKSTSKTDIETALSPHLTTQFSNEQHLIMLNIAYHVSVKIFEGSFTSESVSGDGHKFYMTLKMNEME